jgi:hypothetical protein
MSNILVTTTDTGAIIVLTGASAIVGTGHVIADETVAVPNEPIIDFQGAGVTVTDDPGVKTIVTIPGGGHTIADEGVNLPAELILNFVGAGVTVTDNAGVSTIVTIPGGMAGTDIYFKVSAADTTESYGNTKLTVTAPLVKAIGTPGGNETLNFSIPVATAIADGYLSAANFISFLAGYNDKINSVTFSTATGIITFTQQDGGTLTVDIDGRFLQLDQTASQTIINGQPIQDTLTASELVATDGSKKLQSLAVATYPSLVELSYVKGVTSGIQVQINGKQAGHVNLTSLAALAFGATSFVKMTAAGTFALDTNTYLTTVTAHNLLSATHGDTLADNVVRGDILIGNATPKWARLAKGAEGTFIRYNATDLTISTLTIPNTLVQYSVLASNTADILSAVTLAQQTLLGRLTGGAVAAITIGIADDNILQVDDATAADNDYAKFTANGIEGVPYATVLSDIAALPLAGGTMSGDIQLGETDIKLDAVLSGDEKWSGIVITGTAGSAMTSGEVIFLASDGKWDKVDGILDGTDTGFSKELGITLTTANDTDPIEILKMGKVRSAKFPALTVGSPVYLSDTAGELVVAQPSTNNFCIRVVGFAITAEDLYFNPSNDYIVYKT